MYHLFTLHSECFHAYYLEIGSRFEHGILALAETMLGGLAMFHMQSAAQVGKWHCLLPMCENA